MLNMCIICFAHSHAEDDLLAFASKHAAHAHAHPECAEVAHNDRLLLLHAPLLLGRTSHTPQAQRKHQRWGVPPP